ncbi:MAG: CvpA family protein [Clostridia bacterium]|nr:CvpA family protein [Clostridia bacterium]
MAIVVDVVFAAILIFSIIRHFRLGLACSVLSAGKFLFSLLLAAILCRPVATLVMLGFEQTEMSYATAEILSGVLSFVLIFVAVFILSGLIIRMLSKIKIPIITRVDKLLGLVLGLVIGILSISALSTVLYSILEVSVFIDSSSSALDVYYDSYLFRSVYELKIFEFIRSLI